MSFERPETLPQFLLPIARYALEQKQVRNSPTRLEFTLDQGSLSDLVLLKSDGSTLLPDDTTQALLNQVRLALANEPTAVDGSYIILTDKEQVISQLTTNDETPAAGFKVTKHANNDGLALRSALQAQGHTQGYTRQEIDRAEKEAGIAFPPEVRFFWASVSGGKIADGPQGEIFASSLTADFGDLPAGTPLPTARVTDIVQPLPEHKFWLEIAYDATNHYAVDLAPGTAGAIGQIIGRSTDGLLPPHLVAHSLSQFVKGDWVSCEEAAQSWGQQTLKRSWALPSKPLGESQAASLLQVIDDSKVAKEKQIEEESRPLEGITPRQTPEMVDDTELLVKLTPATSISTANDFKDKVSTPSINTVPSVQERIRSLGLEQEAGEETDHDEFSQTHKKLPRKLKKRNQKDIGDSPSSIENINELSAFVADSSDSSHAETPVDGLANLSLDYETSSQVSSPENQQQPSPRHSSLASEDFSPIIKEEYDTSALDLEHERVQTESHKAEESGFRAALKRFFIG